MSSEKLLENPALWPSLLHPADQDRVLKAYRNLEGSDFGNHEYRILDAKGRTHWLSERFLAVTDDLGNPVRIEGITTDVTTIKARELALRQARKFAENLAENSLDMIIGVDGMRRITEFNKAAEETFQYSREEVLGEPVTLLYQNADIHAQIHEEVYKAGRFYGEVINTRKDGTFFTALLSATPILDLEGRVCGMIGISRDITERKKREALLTLLESAVSHLEESIMITNAPDQDRLPRVVFVNSAFQKTTGYPPPEVIGMHPDLLLGPQSDRDAFQAVENSLRAGKPSVARTVNYRKDGSQFLARWHASPVPDEVGTIRHWVFILLDITEHSKVQEELEQSRKLRAIGEIAGGVAHEFSNLLSPMLIQTGLISRTYPDDAVLNDMLRPIRTAIKQAASLNQSILTLGRKSSDKRDIMSLNSIVEESAKLFSSTGDQRIQLSLDLSPDLHPIWLVRSQISQIVINLGFNARDTLMEKLDRLAIQSDMDDWIPEIHVCTKLVHDVMDKRAQSPKQRRIDCQCLSIQDNGLGMSAETRNRLFEPFFTTKEGGKGTGLGMAVVWNLVDLLGGWIEVESTLGSGTRFDIFFPQYVSGIPTALTQVPQEFQATWQGAETLRILFVEDNPGSSAKTVE